MALQTDIGRRVPEGALRLTKEEALNYQQSLIRDWPSESEVCFLRYGRHIAALSTSTTSFIIMNYFKNYLRATNKMHLLAFIPGIILPGTFGYLVTDNILTNNILLMKMGCPICHQMKFALSQFYMGIGFPILYGYMSSANVALATKSYPLPSIDSSAKEFWKTSFKIIKEGARKFQFTGLVHTIIVLFLPYLQNKQFLTVVEKLQEKEKALEASEDNISE